MKMLVSSAAYEVVTYLGRNRFLGRIFNTVKNMERNVIGHQLKYFKKIYTKIGLVKE